MKKEVLKLRKKDLNLLFKEVLTHTYDGKLVDFMFEIAHGLSTWDVALELPPTGYKIAESHGGEGDETEIHRVNVTPLAFNLHENEGGQEDDEGYNQEDHSEEVHQASAGRAILAQGVQFLTQGQWRLYHRDL